MTGRRRLASWGRRILGRRPAAPFNLDDAASPSWDERAEVATDLVVENAAQLGWDQSATVTVGDFGAGDERLNRVLRARSAQPYRYMGFDLHPQSELVVELDVTRGLPTEDFDIVFCLGLLEYIEPLEPFLARLQARYPVLVLSYALFDVPHPLTRRERRKRGWLTDYTKEDLERRFQNLGFVLLDARLTNQQRTALWLLTRPAQDD
jgi:hypothetical protein